LRTTGIRTPLLLLLAVLALAGTAGEWQRVWQAAPRPAADGDGAAQAGRIGGAGVPEQPALLGGGAAAITHALRDAGDGPQPRRDRPQPPHPYLTQRTEDGPTVIGLRVAARTRLGFAHDVALRSSGAYSAFGTTLPPPLLA
jgi:hypothetical protein